jgi:hypothetical protein
MKINEFEQYLNLLPCPMQHCLKSWFVEKKLPQLFLLYQKHCCALAASTSVESLWSKAGFLVLKKQT